MLSNKLSTKRLQFMYNTIIIVLMPSKMFLILIIMLNVVLFILKLYVGVINEK